LAYSGQPWHEAQRGRRCGRPSASALGRPVAIVPLRRDWRLGGILLMMFVFNAAFYIDYRAIDKQTMSCRPT
jgi:hypothetical protein